MPATRLAPFLGAKEGNQPIDPLVAGNGPRRWRLANRLISATPADRCIGESSCRLAENGFRPASSGGPASHADSGKCVRKKESRGTRVPTTNAYQHGPPIQQRVHRNLAVFSPGLKRKEKGRGVPCKWCVGRLRRAPRRRRLRRGDPPLHRLCSCRPAPPRWCGSGWNPVPKRSALRSAQFRRTKGERKSPKWEGRRYRMLEALGRPKWKSRLCACAKEGLCPLTFTRRQF